jgi:hypothetical protein
VATLKLSTNARWLQLIDEMDGLLVLPNVAENIPTHRERGLLAFMLKPDLEFEMGFLHNSPLEAAEIRQPITTAKNCTNPVSQVVDDATHICGRAHREGIGD